MNFNKNCVIVGALLTSFFMACGQNKKNVPISIIPLKPYVFQDTITNNNRLQHIRVEFYLVINAPSDTAILKNHIQKFNRDKLPDVEKSFDGLQRIFYKESKEINGNNAQSIGDILDHHSEDVIAEELWMNRGVIYSIQFYRDGNFLTNEKAIELQEIK